MPTIMTGSALNLTVPQLDTIIGKLKNKLEKNEDIQRNPTLSSKINNLIYDYTKAKTKIIRYYNKTLKKYPQLVKGKLNTLTLVKIARMEGKEGKAINLENKREKWAYNVADFMKDTKGLAVGLAVTSGVLGVANAIAMTQGTNIAALIGQGLTKAFGLESTTVSILGKQFASVGIANASAFASASLITAGVAIAALAIFVPKIARMVKRIKHNKTVAREFSNEALLSTMDDELDLSKHTDVEKITNLLKSNPDLREYLSKETNLLGYSTLEQSRIKRALFDINKAEKDEIEQNQQAIGATREIEEVKKKYIKALKETPNKSKEEVEQEYYNLQSKTEEAIIKLQDRKKRLDIKIEQDKEPLKAMQEERAKAIAERDKAEQALKAERDDPQSAFNIAVNASNQNILNNYGVNLQSIKIPKSTDYNTLEIMAKTYLESTQGLKGKNLRSKLAAFNKSYGDHLDLYNSDIKKAYDKACEIEQKKDKEYDDAEKAMHEAKLERDGDGTTEHRSIEGQINDLTLKLEAKRAAGVAKYELIEELEAKLAKLGISARDIAEIKYQTLNSNQKGA